jgi:transposase-like protein
MPPGNFDEAIRSNDVTCPRCGARDIAGASPTLEREQDGRFTCTVCSHNFAASSWAYRATQEQLKHDEGDT